MEGVISIFINDINIAAGVPTFTMMTPLPFFRGIIYNIYADSCGERGI